MPRFRDRPVTRVPIGFMGQRFVPRSGIWSAGSERHGSYISDDEVDFVEYDKRSRLRRVSTVLSSNNESTESPGDIKHFGN